MDAPMTRFFAKQALLPSGIVENVMFEVKNGFWHKITANSMPDGAEVLQGLLIPSLINTHSHAFQRVFAGKTEKRENKTDNFWSWRVKMYQAALTLSPQDLYDVALYDSRIFWTQNTRGSGGPLTAKGRINSFCQPK